MFRVSRLFRWLPSTTDNKAARWHKIIVLLALALYIGSAGQTTLVQAAPPADETAFSVDIATSQVPDPLCTNSLYHIKFFARVRRVADLNGNKINLNGGLAPASLTVRASSSDASVAGFHPEEEHASALDSGIPNTGVVVFLLQTEGPGSATLTFAGQTAFVGESIIFPLLQLPVEVVNCRFKVTITSIVSGFGPNIGETAVSSVTGELQGNADGTVTGEADVTFHTQHTTECLSAVQIAPPSKAALQVSRTGGDDGLLTVNVTYDQIMLFQTNTITCGAGVTSYQQHQFQPPPLSFTVPTTAASFSRPVSLQMGEMGLSGTAIIRVEPIEDQ
ncbi:MAG TPA: hypothetical protein VFI68_13255 [Anaerolineales bacterium]|nr:hypothetical protein [Anaerolineales bacterium]